MVSVFWNWYIFVRKCFRTLKKELINESVTVLFLCCVWIESLNPTVYTQRQQCQHRACMCEHSTLCSCFPRGSLSRVRVNTCLVCYALLPSGPLLYHLSHFESKVDDSLTGARGTTEEEEEGGRTGLGMGILVFHTSEVNSWFLHIDFSFIPGSQTSRQNGIE